MNNKQKIFESFLKSANLLGLNEVDLKAANEFLEHNEFGLCFDTVLTQLYEYDIEINKEFYSLISKVADIIDIPKSNFEYMQELIRDEKKR